MTDYTIERVDAIMINDISYPAFYFKPDDKLLDFLYKNSNNDYQMQSNFPDTYVIVNNTQSIYDNIVFKAKIYKSSCIPNYRPNFFDDTGLYIALLDTLWDGYIYNYDKAYIRFYDLQQNPIVQQDNENNEKIKENSVDTKEIIEKYSLNYHDKNQYNFFNVINIKFIIVILFLLFGSLLFRFINK